MEVVVVRVTRLGESVLDGLHEQQSQVLIATNRAERWPPAAHTRPSSALHGIPVHTNVNSSTKVHAVLTWCLAVIVVSNGSHQASEFRRCSQPATPLTDTVTDTGGTSMAYSE